MPGPCAITLGVRCGSAFRLLINNRFRGILNVGSGIGVSMRTLAELALDVAGEGAREVTETAPLLLRSTNVLDISETMRILGWWPSMPLKTELRRVLHFGEAAE